MKRRVIIFIIILMSVALIGLTVVQVYWIRNAISVRQANFKRSLNEVASNISFKLEKLEMERQLLMKVGTYYQYHDSHETLDTVDLMLLEKLQTIKSRVELEDFYNRYFLAEGVFEELFDLESEEQTEPVIDGNIIDSLLHDELNKHSIDAKCHYGVFRSSSGYDHTETQRGSY